MLLNAGFITIEGIPGTHSQMRLFFRIAVTNSQLRMLPGGENISYHNATTAVTRFYL